MPLDLAVHALRDPTRHAVVIRPAEPFDMAWPSFVQHLKVLEDCGLIASEKRGRSRWCRLDRLDDHIDASRNEGNDHDRSV